MASSELRLTSCKQEQSVRLLAANKPAIVFEVFCMPRSARQHVSLEDYAALLRATVGHLREAGAHSTIIITPPPIDEEARKVSRREVRSRELSSLHALLMLTA